MAGQHGTESVPIHVQAALNTSYDSSILGYSVDSTGKLRPTSGYGFDANLGASGRKRWRRSFVGLDYGGNYSHFAGNSFFNGTNHQLNLAMGTQFGSRFQFTTQIGAGTSNRFLGGPSVFQSSEFEFLVAPNSELFDSRSYFLGNTTAVTYSLSQRNSVRFSGTGSTVRRRARGLTDMRSYGASVDWVRRISRRTSVGISYNFTHYDFEKIFGESEVHTLGAHASRRIGRDWNFSTSLTGTKQSTVGVRTVALDPILSSILGRASGSEVFESNNLLYGYSFQASRALHRSSLTGNISRSVNPGNGYFLTSINQIVGMSFNHNVNRDLSLSGSFGYSRLVSLGFASGAFSTWTGGGGVTSKITESLGINARIDWRTFDLQRTTFGRTGYRVSMGVTYFPQRGIAGLW